MNYKNKILDILSNAISDVGYWSWWTSDLPNIFQIEFGGTQLWISPKEKGKPPVGQIAVTFKNLLCVSFLSKNKTDSDWYKLLHEDKIKSLTINYDEFAFTDKNLIKEIINKAKRFDTLIGEIPKEANLIDDNYNLAFWASDKGLFISAKEMKIFTHNRELKFEEIEELNKKWWEYWKEYWEKKYSSNPLPNDYACEVTIPIKE